MITTVKCIFKGIKHVETKEYVQDGIIKTANERYEFKFDEVVAENDFEERIVRISPNETEIIEQLAQIKPYQQIVCQFKLVFSKYGIILKLIKIDI